MPTDLPIACSLNATELPRRLAEMAALGRAALVDVRHQPAHAELRFAARAGIRERVETIVDAESACCAFLTMEVGDEPDLVVLRLAAPADAEAIVAGLVEAFRGEQIA
jgi:hypothetical protein